MMAEKFNLQGKKFGRLLVVSLEGSKNNHRYWNCVCDCGKINVLVSTNALRKDRKKSCGCLEYENRHNLNGGRPANPIMKTRLHHIWERIKSRCYCITDEHYKWYGGRGIVMTDEWKGDFKKFYDWAMANGYQDNLTIERLNVNGIYEPSNCTWIPNNEQQKNTRRTVYKEYMGKIYTLWELAKILNIPYGTLRGRHVKKVSNEKLFSPVRGR